MYPFKPHFENVLSVFISTNELNLSQDGAGAEVLGPFRKLQIWISLRNSSRKK